MNYPRIYYKKKINIFSNIEITDTFNCHYLKNVLRIKYKDIIIIFNNEPIDFYTKVIKINSIITLKVIKLKNNNNISPLYIHLAQVISLNKKKMNLIIQKSTELGVKEITPIYLLNKNTKINFIKNKIIEKWKKIIISACQQCRRNNLPIINQPTELNNWFIDIKNKKEKKIIFHTNANKKIKDITCKIKNIIILMGYEKGFSNEEIQSAMKNNFHVFSLGERILKMETATIAAISILQSKYGDI
ncbi:16S rRNA (uracil(1498)-N(3))-methyltransferase [Buchnera aphidicola (Thelaxes californica)]|uniref:Ribosomal RNA small subunit methyltransferase E n=1 Tax=Buchnera aphidicola (Thelaxes californica) TaxID=1315998 RepID=A0A4D6YFG8_9GAMM|nr:16S rRNA (uracil(1498)-N(3))-methyltransferase [Buchnera aphidicola]QCI26843.1 16S rRNA (uracil(1498)-N(3))-methyltransferase [Buchnera aphidicola (Thelaxes californica)]